MTRSFHIQKITIRARAIFQCDTCKVSAEGDSFTADFDSVAQMDRHFPGPNLMPIGWASYHNPNIHEDHLRFCCPNCKS